MNYLAHIFFAQPTVESVCGNLMGDFMKGVKLEDQPLLIQQGVLNHRLVDRVTDEHPEVKALKKLLSPSRRRFSGIIVDVVFDHLLIRHWAEYNSCSFVDFVDRAHEHITSGRHYMPVEMQRVTGLMIEQEWLRSYHSLQGVAEILDRMSRRIRFDNQLHGAIEEIAPQIDAYDQAFAEVFPALIEAVANAGIENQT